MQVLARAQAEAYRAAEPYPHAVFEDFLPAPVLDAAAALVPAPDSGVSWRRVEARMADGAAAQAQKLGLAREFEVPPLLRRLFWELNSGSFLRFLSDLTGIAGLIPDPTLQGGGVHQVLEGGVLAVHADFTWHKLFGLKRRINVLIYLNRDWQEEWGGHLQLWSPDMQRCVRRLSPDFGRCVVFNTTANSFHGHPEPVRVPPGVTRKSIAMYYYTAGREDTEVADTTATDWRPSAQAVLPAVE